MAIREDVANCVDRQEVIEAQVYALERDASRIWRALEGYVDSERARMYAREQSVEV